MAPSTDTTTRLDKFAGDSPIAGVAEALGVRAAALSPSEITRARARRQLLRVIRSRSERGGFTGHPAA